jgi:hypothetical protein
MVARLLGRNREKPLPFNPKLRSGMAKKKGKRRN